MSSNFPPDSEYDQYWFDLAMKELEQGQYDHAKVCFQNCLNAKRRLGYWSTPERIREKVGDLISLRYRNGQYDDAAFLLSFLFDFAGMQGRVLIPETIALMQKARDQNGRVDDATHSRIKRNMRTIQFEGTNWA